MRIWAAADGEARSRAAERCYSVTPAARRLGVKFVAACAGPLTVSASSREVDEFVVYAVERWRRSRTEGDALREGYRRLLRSVGAAHMRASPETLEAFVDRRGSLPRVNSVVDAYNAQSLLLSIVVSAHDWDKLTGDILVAVASGKEQFMPLGKAVVEPVPAGEWLARDRSHVLCRMNCKQSALSPVGMLTKWVLVYVQGSPATDDDLLTTALGDVCRTINCFAGGGFAPLPEC